MTSATSTWTVPPLGIELHAQTDNQYCAPACTQMILSVRGYQHENPDTTWQSDLYQAILRATPAGSPMPLGDPVSVATIVTQPPQYVPHKPVPRLNDYRAIRKRPPDEACAAVAYALAHGEPSAVLVLDGQHWVVVYGGEGQGRFGDPDFRIDSFWMCNPDNGYYGGIPGGQPTPRPKGVCYIAEWVCYADFVYTYFTAASEYEDGHGQYGVVTD